MRGRADLAGGVDVGEEPGGLIEEVDGVWGILRAGLFKGEVDSVGVGRVLVGMRRK